MGDVRIDLVVRDPATGDIRLVFVEEGPWPDPEASDLLSRIQARIYDAVDSALEGALADRFPESRGRRIRLVLDCFNHPPAAVARLAEILDAHLQGSGEYADYIRVSPHVSAMSVEFHDRGPLLPEA